MRHLVAGLLRLYQLTLSFWLGRNCRFLPTCSEYTRQAVLRFGVVRGLRLGGRRLLRCHPWGPSQASVTFDPVPDSWQGTPCQHERCHPR